MPFFVWTALLLVACPAVQANGLFQLRPGGTTGIAALPDGSFLASSEWRIVRVHPDGHVLRFAGTGSPGLPSDGAQATATSLYDAQKISLAPDGSLLVALGYACTPCSFVARVAPDGTISRVAGDDPSSPTGNPLTTFPDGVAATSVRLRRSWMEPTTDGGFLIANGSQVQRVDTAGRISTVPADSSLPGVADIASLPNGTFVATVDNYVFHVNALGSVRTIAGSADDAGFGGDGGPARRAALSAPTGIEAVGDGGGVVIADTGNNRVRRIDRNGRIDTLAGGGPTEWCGVRSGYFRGDGRDPMRAAVCGPVDMVPDPMGGWLIAHGDGVSFLASPGTRRMGVAITRPHAERGRLTFVATTAGSATAEVRRRGQVVATRTVPTRPGRNTVRLPRGLVGIHRVALRARNAQSSDGDTIGLLLGGQLSRQLGEALIEGTIAGGASRPPTAHAHAADGPYEYLDRCRQFGRRRVDCVVIDQDVGGCSVTYVRLRPSGLVRVGSYGCVARRGFRDQIPAASRTWPLPL